MVNLHNPVLTPQLGFAFVKLWHVLAGIFLWEFMTTLDYEWKVFRGRLPYRWTIWIYSVARVFCLVGLIVNLVGVDTTSRLNCQVWISFVATLVCVSQGCASLLIVLRIIAIWNRNKVAKVATLSIWGIGIGFHIQYVARLRSVWNPAELSCSSVTIKKDLLGLIPTIVFDLILILIMLVGLILLSRRGAGSFGLTPLIIKQGIIWLSLGFFSEAPGAVMAMMSSNDQFIDLLLTPGTITMIIAATRMHRYLVDFAFGSPNGSGDTLVLGSVAYSRTKPPRASMIPSNCATRSRIEVTVHKAFEQHSTGPMNDNSTYETADAHINEKPTALDLGAHAV